METSGENHDNKGKRIMNGNGVPIAVLITSILAVAGLAWGVRGEEKSAIYKEVYENELRTLTARMDKLADEAVQRSQALTTLAANQSNHVLSGGHTKLEERVRDLERQNGAPQ